jgi:hypothetical protein
MYKRLVALSPGRAVRAGLIGAVADTFTGTTPPAEACRAG